MNEEYRLQLLGIVQVERRGEPLQGFVSRKAVACLGYLALQNQPVSRSYLADLFWGDKPESRGRANLSRVLHNLSTLLPDCLQANRYTIQFRRSNTIWLDVDTFEELVTQDEFEALVKAVALYRGSFMAGFYLNDCVEFETWLAVERERWQQRATQILQKLIDNCIKQSEFERGLEFASRLLALDSWREEAHQQMMRLLAYTGQRSAALAQYEICCRMLAEALGVEPSKGTRLLYEQIRDGQLDQPQERSEDAVATSAVLPSFLSSHSQSKSQPSQMSMPFVARERELEQLDRFLDLALARQGRVIFVTGEAGSGKTALVQEFARRRQQTEPGLIIVGGNCNAHGGVGDPYLPFREILGLLTGDVEAKWSAGVIDRAQAQRLWNLIPQSVQALVDVAPDLIDIFVAGSVLVKRAAMAVSGEARWLTQLKALLDSRVVNQAPANLKPSDLFEQYTRMLRRLAQKSPLLIVLDDLQWVDAGSLGLLFHLGRQLQTDTILIVGIYRPSDVVLGRNGERHPLVPVVNEFQRHFGKIQVKLGQVQNQVFVETFLDIEPNQLGVAFRQAFYHQTRGHALFSVEMLRGLKERGDLVKNTTGQWVERGDIDWGLLPARVEGIIGERLGRLPVLLQAILKVASLEGENFRAEVIAQVLKLEAQEVIQHLSNALAKQHYLVKSQGIERVTNQRISHYRFSHILFQRYLYSNLDDTERSFLHEAVGLALEQLYGDRTEEIAVNLARHFQAADMTEKAINYLNQAGNRAVQLSGYDEAVAHFTQGLVLVELLPPTPKRVQQELQLQMALGRTLMATKGYADSTVGSVFARAHELCQQIGETPQLFPVLYGLWGFYFVGGKHLTAKELAAQFLHLAQHQQDTGPLMAGHRILGTSLFFLGEISAAQEHLKQAMVLYNPHQHHALAFLHGQDHGVVGLSMLAWSAWGFGYPDQALVKSSEALALARDLSHSFSLAFGLIVNAVFHQFRRDVEPVDNYLRESIAISTEQRFSYLVAWGMILQSWVWIEQGDFEKGVAQLQQGLSAYQATGAEIFQPYFLALLVEAYQLTGQIDKGLETLTTALAIMGKNQERFFEAELYRLKGELLQYAKGKQPEDELSAEAYFLKAIAVACQQSAKMIELRATISLSRLWQQHGKTTEACQMLAKIYNWFTEGFDTIDLKEAKMLLDVL